jgi:hypothetical protein
MKTIRRLSTICVLFACVLSTGCRVGNLISIGPAVAPSDTPAPTAVPTASRTPAPTATAIATSTPNATATPAASATATAIPSPTATSTPAPTSTPTIVDGWKKFEGNGMELWLPEHFMGGNLTTDLEILLEGLKELGPDYEKMAQMLKENPSAFVLVAFDTQLSPSGVMANVNVGKAKILSAISIDMYVDILKKGLPAEFTITSSKPVKLKSVDAGAETRQLLVKASLKGTDMREVIYLVKMDNTIWIMTYTVGAKDLKASMPMIERSADTFKVTP